MYFLLEVEIQEKKNPKSIKLIYNRSKQIIYDFKKIKKNYKV
jgi:hypothetical protein